MTINEEIIALLNATLNVITAKAETNSNLFSIQERFDEILSQTKRHPHKLKAYIERDDFKELLVNVRTNKTDPEIIKNLKKIQKYIENGTI